MAEVNIGRSRVRPVDRGPPARDVWVRRKGNVRMRREQFLIQSVCPPRKRRSSQIVAKDGHAAPGKCGEDLDKGKEWVSSWTSKVKRHNRYAASCGPTTSGSCPFPKGKMLRNLIEEAARWDLAPKPASLCWTSTNLSIDTKSGCHRFSFEEKFKILGYALNRRESARRH